MDRAASKLRPWLGLAAVYLGLVGGLYAIARLFEVGEPHLTAFLLTRFVFLMTAVVAFVVLGSHDLQRVFGRSPAARWLAIGPLTGLLCYGINLGWVVVSSDLRGIHAAWLGHEVTPWTLVLAPLVIAYTEELVFRGVLWAALERVGMSSSRIIVQTAVLFALCHLVNGAGLWELPHRFVCGLLLGYLRFRSGSIVPAVHAHFIVLALAAAAG